MVQYSISRKINQPLGDILGTEREINNFYVSDAQDICLI